MMNHRKFPPSYRQPRHGGSRLPAHRLGNATGVSNSAEQGSFRPKPPVPARPPVQPFLAPSRTRPLPNDAVQSGYHITIRTGNFTHRSMPKPGEPVIGHSSVVLNSPAGTREYNVTVNDYDQIRGKPLRSLATGSAARVERTAQPVPMTQTSQVNIPISREQFLKAKMYAEREANRGTYVWNAGNNCVHFSHNTVKAAGIDAFSTSPFAGPEHTRTQIARLKIQRLLGEK